MSLKVNTKIKLTQHFIDEIAVGNTIFTNGDGSITTPEFFEAVVVSKTDSLLLVKRVDGDTGNGPNGSWIIRYVAGSPIQVYIPKEIEPVSYDLPALCLGDVFSFAHLDNEYAGERMMFIHFTNRNTMFCLTQGRTSEGDNLVTIPLTGIAQVTFYGKKPFMTCSTQGCAGPITTSVEYPRVQFYCNTHKPSDIYVCADCGANLRASYVHAWTTNQRTGNSIRICGTCADTRRVADQVIQSHSYKPQPKFIRVAPATDDLRSKLYAGCECEVECPREEDRDDDDDGSIIRIRRSPHAHTMRLAKIIFKRFNKPAKWFYLKSDGSLRNGFELVTEPATIEAHQKMLPWKKTFEFMKSQGIDADGTTTCGLHIHVNKNHMSEDHRIRLGYFINSHRVKMESLARRSASEYARFKPANTPMEQMAVNTMGNKYEALNWNPPHTVEFRLFKGTVDHNHLMSSLELAEACILFTARTEIEELKKKTQTWTKFKDFVLHNGFVYLPDYMVEREVM